MDLKIDCDEFRTTANSRGVITIEVEGVHESNLDTIEVAREVSVSTFFEAHSPEEIRDYIANNYNWLNEGVTFDN